MDEAAGISLVVGGTPISVSGFAVLTAIFSVVGLILALILTRTVRRPRTVFVRTTVVLTALSLVPDVAADATVATKMLLMLAHLVAAAIDPGHRPPPAGLTPRGRALTSTRTKMPLIRASVRGRYATGGRRRNATCQDAPKGVSDRWRS